MTRIAATLPQNASERPTNGKLPPVATCIDKAGGAALNDARDARHTAAL